MVTKAVAISRLAKHYVIISKLSAVETQGSTTAICSDGSVALIRILMMMKEVCSGGVLRLCTGRRFCCSRGITWPVQVAAGAWERYGEEEKTCLEFLSDPESSAGPIVIC